MARRKELKTIVPIILAILLAGFPGCRRKGSIITRSGTLFSSGGNWKVELLSSRPGLRITDMKKTGEARQVETLTGKALTFSITPSDWTNSENAFVYIDQDERVWAFNGTDRSFIHEKSKNGSRDWDFQSWPGDIPNEVKQRIPPNATQQAKHGASAQPPTAHTPK